jgi:hypothetical protein
MQIPSTLVSFSSRLRLPTLLIVFALLSISAGGAKTASAQSVSTILFQPSKVAVGVSATGTIFLSAPAPAGGLVVSLSSDSPAVKVPASVTVAPGNQYPAFTAATSAVSAVTNVVITATLNGTSGTGKLEVTPSAYAIQVTTK